MAVNETRPGILQLMKGYRRRNNERLGEMFPASKPNKNLKGPIRTNLRQNRAQKWDER